MRSIWLVFKHTVGVTLRQRSFWIFTFLMPIVLLGFNIYFTLQESGLTANLEDEAAEAEIPEQLLVGLVDEGQIIQEIPEDIPAGLFVFYDDAASAAADLGAGQLDQYVVIPADYLATGEIEIYDPAFNLLESSGQGVSPNEVNNWTLPFLLNYNLLEDPVLAGALLNPTPGQMANMQALNPPASETVERRALAEVMALVIPYIYYFILIVVSGYMLQSVTAEKENRTVEILLLSLRPRQLMVGKILGLSSVAMIQLAIWVGAGLFLMNRGTQLLDISSYTFPDGFFVLAVIFLLLGYFLYASIMAAAGAISPSAREAGQVTWLMIIPFIPTLMFSRTFVDDPEGAASIVLSLFPLSAPSAMVTRLAVSEVPWWQVAISLSGLAITTYVAVVLAARFFQPQHLLSQAAFNWRKLATGWRE